MKNAWTAILLYHATIVIFVFILNPGISIPKLLSGWNNTIGIPIVLACSSAGIIIILLWKTIAIEQADLGTMLANVKLEGTSWYLFIVYFIIVHPVLEEIFWRGYFLADTETIKSLWHDITFGAFHFFVLILFIGIPWAILGVLVLTAMSRVWRMITINQNGLLIPIISHIVADMSVMAACLYIVSD